MRKLEENTGTAKKGQIFVKDEKSSLSISVNAMEIAVVFRRKFMHTTVGSSGQKIKTIE